MSEYEKMVKDSNILYNQKFKEDREIMFNPKLTINKNNNELLLSTLMKKISEKQKTRQCFLLETKTNIDYQNNKYESLNSLDNSILREKNYKINKVNKKCKKQKHFIDEQKNPEFDDTQENLSKLKTPIKLKNYAFFEKNKNEILQYHQKNKLIRRFSAMPKVIKKNNINKINNEENKIKVIYKGSKNNERKILNKNSPSKNYIDCSKRENDKNDSNIFKNQLDNKKKKFKTKSVKNSNAFFLEKSTFIDNNEKKWKIDFKNNKLCKKLSFKNKKEIIDKKFFDGNLFINNEMKAHGFLNNEKNSKLLSFTEQSTKIKPKSLFSKRLPKIFDNKNKIN